MNTTPFRLVKLPGSMWPDHLAEYDDHRCVARVFGTGYPLGVGWSPESDRLAHLLAEAPCMLAALRKLAAWDQSCDDPVLISEACSQARAIIRRIDAAEVRIGEHL